MVACLRLDVDLERLLGGPTSTIGYGLQNISLTVSDGRGGTAQQSFKVNVQAEAGNHAPKIVSTPGTSVFVPTPTLINFETIPADTLVRDQFQDIGVQIRGVGQFSGLVYNDTDF